MTGSCGTVMQLDRLPDGRLLQLRQLSALERLARAPSWPSDRSRARSDQIAAVVRWSWLICDGLGAAACAIYSRRVDPAFYWRCDADGPHKYKVDSGFGPRDIYELASG